MNFLLGLGCILFLSAAFFAQRLLHLLKLFSAYSSKTVCSGHFLSKRSFSTIKASELSYLKWSMIYATIYEEKDESLPYVESVFMHPLISDFLQVTTKSLYMGPSFGCTVNPLFNAEKLAKQSVKEENDHSNTHETDINQCVQRFVDSEFTPASFKVNQTRAVVIVHNDKLIAEVNMEFCHLYLTSLLELEGEVEFTNTKFDC